MGSVDFHGNPQIAFYFPGIGSQLNMPLWKSKIFAKGIRENSLQVYLNISSNFEPSDKIYIFGFSRGAIIARIVASLISKVGILFPEHVDRIDTVWKMYEDNVDDADISHRLNSHRFENSNRNVIEFLGLFDSVSGPKDVVKLQKDNINAMNSASHITHIVALDEHRYLFSPIIFSNFDKNTTEQIWMTGVHSDVGGVYKDRLLGLISLLTMVDRISLHTDLSFYDNYFQSVHQKLIASLHDETFPHVNNERNTLKFKLLKVLDSYKGSTRTQYIDRENSSIHPFSCQIVGRDVRFKSNKITKYSISQKIDLKIFKLNSCQVTFGNLRLVN